MRASTASGRMHKRRERLLPKGASVAAIFFLMALVAVGLGFYYNTMKRNPTGVVLVGSNQLEKIVIGPEIPEGLDPIIPHIMRNDITLHESGDSSEYFTVYISLDSSSYHMDTCELFTGGTMQMNGVDMAAAVRSNYTSCDLCNPPDTP